MQLQEQLGSVQSGQPHAQYAALPWRMHAGRLEFLLLTSRDTGRWVIPKGWPKPGREPWETAAEEAYEEGGIHGRIEEAALGWFDYQKYLDDDDDIDCRVTVFPLQVQSESYTFPECAEREREWFDARKAMTLVEEAGLRRLMSKFIRRQILKRTFGWLFSSHSAR